MKKDKVVLLSDYKINEMIYDKEIELGNTIVINNKTYQAFGDSLFLLELEDMKKIDVTRLREDISFAPLMVHSSGFPYAPNFGISKDEDGLIVKVSACETTKGWKHDVISLQCYMEHYLQEIKENEDFLLENYNDEDSTFLFLDFSFKLMDALDLGEATKQTHLILDSLEKRVMKNAAKSARAWAVGTLN